MGKKKAKKKATKKAQKKKGTKKNFETKDVSSNYLKALANYALQSSHADFRKNAAKNGNFRDALADEIGKTGTGGFKKMSDDDKGYCEGWLDMLRLSLDLGAAEIPDTVLVAKIEKQMNQPDDDEYYTMSS